MLKVMVATLVITITLAVCAFAQEGGSQANKRPGNIDVHGNSTKTDRVSLLDVLKKQTLANHPSSTIGNAFDSYRYFSRVEWKESQGSNGKVYFDFTGRFKMKGIGSLFSWDKVVSKVLEVKFVVYPSGDFGVVMASGVKLKKDGTIDRYPLADLKGVLDRIYANKEINF